MNRTADHANDDADGHKTLYQAQKNVPDLILIYNLTFPS